MPLMQNTASDASTSPGRLYSFVVLALATVVACISVVALLAESGKQAAGQAETLTVPVARQLDAAQDSDGPAEVSVPTTLSNQQLLYFLVAAVVIGFIGVLPSRSEKVAASNEVVDAKALAAAAGLPLLGSIFAKATPMPLMEPAKSRNWLAGLVFTGEMVLCLGVVIAIFGCFVGEGISSVFIHNPFEAYAMSVAHLAQSVAGFLGSVPATEA